MAYSYVEMMGRVNKIFKSRGKLMRLISNVGGDVSCRVFIKTLNILPLSCMYIMEIVFCVEMNIGRLEQNSFRHNYNTRHSSDVQSQFFRIDIFKQCIISMGVKLCNKLQNHLKISPEHTNF
jgi:hypothetical protein